MFINKKIEKLGQNVIEIPSVFNFTNQCPTLNAIFVVDDITEYTSGDLLWPS